jgi:hypothetical protein
VLEPDESLWVDLSEAEGKDGRVIAATLNTVLHAVVVEVATGADGSKVTETTVGWETLRERQRVGLTSAENHATVECLQRRTWSSNGT